MAQYDRLNRDRESEPTSPWTAISSLSSIRLETGEKKIWISLYSLLLALATAGNVLVTCFIIARRRLRKAYGFYMLSLTLADFTMLYFECFFNFVYILDGHWWFGSIYCVTNNYLSEVTTATSIFTLAVTSYDRYLAVVKPFHPRTSRNKAILTVVSAWLLAAIVAVPTIVFSATYNQQSQYHGEVIKCGLQWPRDNILLNDSTYRLFIFTMTYLLPSLIMAYCNIRIGYVLWRATELGHQGIPQHQIDLLIKKRKQLAKVMLAILVVFCVCWLPYQVFLMCQTFFPGTLTGLSNLRVHMIVYWLAMANALFNPLLFYRMDKQYRTCVRNFFKKSYTAFRERVTLSTVETTI